MVIMCNHIHILYVLGLVHKNQSGLRQTVEVILREHLSGADEENRMPSKSQPPV